MYLRCRVGARGRGVCQRGLSGACCVGSSAQPPASLRPHPSGQGASAPRDPGDSPSGLWFGGRLCPHTQRVPLCRTFVSVVTVANKAAQVEMPDDSQGPECMRLQAHWGLGPRWDGLVGQGLSQVPSHVVPHVGVGWGRAAVCWHAPGPQVAPPRLEFSQRGRSGPAWRPGGFLP